MRRSLERLTASSLNYWGSFALDGVVAVAMIAAGIAATAAEHPGGRGGACAVGALVALGGAAACSFVEYGFHRWWFHARFAETARRLHALHHEAPRTLVGTPFFVSLITCAAAFGLGRCVTSSASAASFAGGLLFGHALEGTVHHLLHHADASRTPWLRRLKRRHLVHHQRGDENFGVASAVWDRIFGTESPARRPSPRA